MDAKATGRLIAMAAGDYASMRASDEDRGRVQTHLNEAFAEGRLTQQEWDERATALANARTYGDLDMLIADLPRPIAGPQLVPQQPVQRYAPPRTNGLAIAALVCGLGQLAMGPPATVAAIVLGHKAQRQIRQTGEPGDGLARAGLVMGYLGLSVAVVGAVAVLLVSIWIAGHGHVVPSKPVLRPAA